MSGKWSMKIRRNGTLKDVAFKHNSIEWRNRDKRIHCKNGTRIMLEKLNGEEENLRKKENEKNP